MTCPAISVLLPVYNTQRYLAQAVESVLAQSFGDFELIVIDDGSTDRSSAILSRLARADARVHVIRRPNTGIVGALNDGLAAARADIVARMDADDVCLPQRFAQQFAWMGEHPDCVAVGCRVLLVDPYGLPLFVPEHQLGHDAIDRELLRGEGWAIVHPAAMMRRQAVLDAGGYRPPYQDAEDLDLFLRLAERGRLANLPEVLLHYRQHLQSINHTRRQRQAEVIRAAVADACRRRGIPQPPIAPGAGPGAACAGQQLRDWAWQALRIGRPAIARRHAWDAVRLAPGSVESWRLMYCALRGR